jgi:hypothetical protein
MAIFGDRIAGLPTLLQTLYYHPQGMPFAALAAEVGRGEGEVRETLRTYHLTDLAEYLPDLVSRPEVLEFFGGHPDDDGDALRAPKVRLVAADPGRELGVAYTSLPDLARFYRIATDAMELDPTDEVLVAAVTKLREALLPGLHIVPDEPLQQLADLQDAITARRLLRLTYARFWSPVIEEKIVQPYWLIRTRRGWELDAAPGDERSDLRTYLLSNIRRLEVLPEVFDPPPDLPSLITEHRTETPVTLRVPHFSRWAVDKYAERVELVSDSLEAAVLQVFVLRPVRLRVGMMLVAGGPTAEVLEPDDLREAGREVAADILSRYHDDPTPAS